MMKMQDIRESSDKELNDELTELTLQYTRMRLNHTVSPTDDTSQFAKIRRTIARIKTEMKERQIREAAQNA